MTIYTNKWLQRNVPLWRASEQLTGDIEQAVRRFSRYHKYTFGSELRQLSHRLLASITLAIKHKPQRLSYVEQADSLVQRLLLHIQLAKSQQAFTSFKEFETIAKKAVMVANAN